MSAPLIVFDLDGTLIDTAPDLIGTLNALLEREGLAPVPLDSARILIGGGGRRMIQGGWAQHGRKVTPEQLERLYADFIEYYSEHIADFSLPFPGLDAALDALEDHGCQFAVCTNKTERLAVQLLDTLGLSSRFLAICGHDTFGIPKPDPTILRGTIGRAGGRMETAVMVGDSGTDIDTARAAGIPVVAVDFGYSETAVSLLKPDCVISHYDDLAAAVRALLPAS
ncbi:MAG TPA: HAD family hydrolase [Xanthobacteraceae bacterium]|jgi:phosphoglycolate phosphatase|nr:HAD family hydrolase [Xanthobacteraceae bacterium]